MTTCIRNGKMYQTVPFDRSLDDGSLWGSCRGCAADNNRPLCESLPDDCFKGPGSLIWIEIKNEKPDVSRSTSIRDKDFQVA